jgi:hypothetical protein
MLGPPHDDKWAAGKLVAFFRGIVLRAQGIELQREFDYDKELGFEYEGLKITSIEEEGQAASMGLKEGLMIISIVGKRPGTDQECGMIERTARKVNEREKREGAKLRIVFSTGGTNDVDPEKEAAAIKLANFFRGIVARKKGLEYKREFADGPLGMEVRRLCAMAAAATVAVVAAAERPAVPCAPHCSRPQLVTRFTPPAPGRSSTSL